MRKGWYKKAKKKFVKKRVYDWRYGEGWRSYSDHLEWNNRGGQVWQCSSNAWQQRFETLRKEGFIKAFWLARVLAKKGIGDFSWHKKFDPREEAG